MTSPTCCWQNRDLFFCCINKTLDPRVGGVGDGKPMEKVKNQHNPSTSPSTCELFLLFIFQNNRWNQKKALEPTDWQQRLYLFFNVSFVFTNSAIVEQRLRRHRRTERA